MNHKVQRNTIFLKVGHRGAKAYKTENTIDSYQKAIELGVNAIELDVRISKDLEPVISHDDNLKKVYGRNISLKEVTLKEIRELTANRMMTLEEALNFIEKKVEKIFVELKETGYEKKILNIIRKEKLMDRVVLISFHEEALVHIRKLSANIETGFIYTKFRNPVDYALTLRAQYLLPLYRFVHSANVEAAHRKNIKVIVWTINTKREVREYIAKEVDGIATDKPDIFKGIS
jgi:glycerophosphoryl diester phosphodiesterase